MTWTSKPPIHCPDLSLPIDWPPVDLPFWGLDWRLTGYWPAIVMGLIAPSPLRLAPGLIRTVHPVQTNFSLSHPRTLLLISQITSLRLIVFLLFCPFYLLKSFETLLNRIDYRLFLTPFPALSPAFLPFAFCILPIAFSWLLIVLPVICIDFGCIPIIMYWYTVVFTIFWTYHLRFSRPP